MGCNCCKQGCEVEEERKPLLEGGENPPQYVGPKLAPTKGSDDGFFVIDHEPSKNVEFLSLKSKDEPDGSLNPVQSTPSPSQMLISVQDKSVAFSHSVPSSNVVGDRSFQPVAQMPTSPNQQVTSPDIVSTKVLPEADHTKSAVSTGVYTLDLPFSSHAGVTATVCDDIETDQVGSLSLTRAAITTLDTEPSDSDATASTLTCTAVSVTGDMHDAGNVSDTTPLLSAIAPSTCEDSTDTRDGPGQHSHHEQPTVMQSHFFSEDDSLQGNLTDSAVLSSQLTSIGYHSISSEPETAASSYTGGPQSDVEVSVVETETQTTATSYTGDALGDVEVSMVETENQTTAAVDAEILGDDTKDQTTATSYSDNTQSDAEVSAVDTENQIAAVSDTLGDAEMTVVETENQTTPASYTGGVQNDAEVSNLDLPHSCPGSEEEVDGAPLLQYDETEHLSGDRTNGTTKETALTDSAVLSSRLTSIGYHSISSEAETQIAATSYTGVALGDVEVSVVETENQITAAVDAEILGDDTKDQTTATSCSDNTQSDAEVSAVDTENQIAAVSDTLGDAEMTVVETENQTTATGDGTQKDAAVVAENELATVSDTLGDAETSVVGTENQTTPASYTGGVQNDAEVSNLDLPHSCPGSEEEVDSAPLLQYDETEHLLGDHTNGTTKETALTDSAVLSSQLTSIGYHSISSEAETAFTSYAGGPQSDAEISVTETENQTTATSYTGDALGDVEVSMVETENQTTAAVDAEMLEDDTKDQTTATSYSDNTQSDAEVSAVDTENQIAAVSDTLGDAEMTVVETENQTTPASYTGGVQNDAEVSNLDLPHPCPGSEEEVDSAPLDETKHLLGGHTNGTTKETAMRPQSLDSTHVSLKKKWYDNLRTRVNLFRMAGSSLHREFDALKAISPHDVEYTSARHQVNSSKNRPAAPLPPDTNAMVKLQSLYCAEDFDYINACYVGSPSRPRAYIVTQTPMGNTVGDFWRMVWEQCTSVIVLLTQKMEHLGGLNPKFWPEKGITNYYGLIQSGNWMSGSLSVRTTKEVKDRQIKDLVTRHIELRTEHPVTFSEVELYHYLGWPHHGIARSQKDVVLLLNRVLETKQFRPDKLQAECPVIVVSTHGAGRAGCFSAVAVAHELMTAPQENPSCWTRGDHILDEVVQGLRECRSGLVEDRFQFEFCHQVLLEALTAPKGDTSPAKKRKVDLKQEMKSKKKGYTQRKKLSLA